MLNRAQLIGHVGADPEIRTLASGGRVANFRLATSEQWRDKQTGDRKEATEWHTVVTFNEHLIPVIEQYVRKGSRLFVEGKIQTRKWQDQSGADRWSTEIVLTNFSGTIKLLDRKGEAGASGYHERSPEQYEHGVKTRPADGYGAAKDGDAPPRNIRDEIDDTIPF